MAKHLRFLFYLLLTVVWSAAGSAQTVVFEETFDKCNGKGGNDDIWTAGGANTTKEITDEMVDNEGWGFSTTYPAKSCIKMASNNNPGSTTSPLIKAQSGDSFILTVKAAALEGKTSAKLTITATSGTFDISTFTLAQKEFNTYTCKITNVSGDFRISFQIPKKQQSFIDNVEVSKIESSDLTPTSVSFGSDKDNTNITLTNGKLGGDIFKGYAASETTSVAGTIKYESDATDVATVDEIGNVTIKGFGTATITAIFTPDDTNTYATSKVSYTITNEDKRADAEIAFENDTYTADVNNDSYEGIKLNNPHNLPVTYTTSSDDLMYEDGLAVYKKGVSATYTITAKFEGNEEYKPATVTCTLNVKDINAEVETLPIVFDCNTTQGSTTANNTPDRMFQSPVTISSDDAAFKWTSSTKDYRLYASSTTTISTSLGNIVKIEFEGSDSKKPLNNLKSQTNFNATATHATWTGNAQSVDFKASAQARATKITVTVEVPVAKDLSLDESQANDITAYDNYSVTLKRNLVKDDWNTFCVPFDITEEEAKEAFGDNVKISAFNGTTTTGTTVNFNTVTSIEAGKPYLIKPSIESPADGYKFTMKTISNPETTTAGTEGNVQMRGIYSPTDITTLTTDGTFAAGLGDENAILKANSGAQMRGFRAFFLVPTSLEGQSLKANIGGIITAIDAIHGATQADAPVYNLNGQRMNGKLKAGIYVKNGKKFIVK